MVSAREHLSTRDLFAQGGARIHVNTPLHRGDTPLHDHDFVELAVVRSGHALHRQLDGLAAASAGSAVLLLPGQWHAWERCQSLRLANVCFARDLLANELRSCRDDPRLAPWWSADGPLRFSLEPARAAALLARIDDLRAHCQQPGPLAWGLALAVLGELAQASPITPVRARPDAVVQAILDDLTSRPAEPWTLASLGRRHGLERSYLGRRFRRAVGCAPLTWLARHRCHLAAIRLLCGDESVAQIGAAVGWSDANYFTRCFARHMGMSPGRYRRHLPLPAQAPATADWIQW